MVELILMSIVILTMMLLAAFIFTNALEHLGKHYNIGKGFLGSVIAAVATVLPESMVPIMAFFEQGAAALDKQEIIVGAIIGPQLMLATLAMAILALAVCHKRGIGGLITPISSIVKRDLNYFSMAWIVCFLSLFVPFKYTYLRVCCSITLVFLYISYLYYTYHGDCNSSEQQNQEEGYLDPLLLCKLGAPNRKWTTWIQVLLSFALLLVAAKLFVHDIIAIASYFQISALLVSLILLPIATELPEKFNSIVWARKNQDTLAIGNITGAMVFQGTILPVLGINLPAWRPNYSILLSILVTGAAVIWLHNMLKPAGFKIWTLLCLGLLYGCYCYCILHITF